MNIILSKKSTDLIIFSEVSSESYYTKFLQHPTVPGGISGITISIGYDLGQAAKQNIINDWHDLVSIEDLKLMLSCIGLKGSAAKHFLNINSNLKKLAIPFDIAKQVFYKKDLPKYTKETLHLYPGLEKLEPDAIGALVSMVYNRGASIKGNGREEMASIVHLVAVQDYHGIGAMVSHSKRLWQGKKGMDGIVTRRENEANLITNAVHDYKPEDLIIVTI